MADLAHHPVRLSPGCFYGQTRRTHRGSDFILSEAVYPAGFRVPRHTHELVYLAFLLEGGYWEQFRTGRIDFAPRSLAFQVPHEIRRGDISPRGAHLFHLELGPSWSARLKELGPLPEDVLTYERGELPRLASALHREFRTGDTASALTLEGLILTMLGNVVRARTAEGPRAPRWLARVRERVHEEYANPVSLRELAEEASIHPIRLARAFPRFYGESVAACVRRLRVERAARLLAEGGSSLAEIAAEVGFYDQSHLTRVFKAAKGATPAAYRRGVPVGRPETTSRTSSRPARP